MRHLQWREIFQASSPNIVVFILSSKVRKL